MAWIRSCWGEPSEKKGPGGSGWVGTRCLLFLSTPGKSQGHLGPRCYDVLASIPGDLAKILPQLRHDNRERKGNAG